MDSLCKRYNIDLTRREIHGAIKDARLLASVYLELIGGRQSKLDFEIIKENISSAEEEDLFDINEFYKDMSLKKVNHSNINEEDYKLHLKSIQTIKNSIWEKIDN